MSYVILIIEDEPDINKLLSRILEAAGYRTRQAFSGTEAGLLLEKEIPDLILLDLMLPGLPGEELLHKIREDLGLLVPVLIISAKGLLSDKVTLLNSGADDYLTKPFEPEEVVARVRAALRRTEKTPMTGAPAANTCITYRRLKLYPESRKVTVSGKELELTAHEYDLLHLFIRNPAKVYSRESLYELVWNGGYYGENNTVNVHISNLRKKMKEADPHEEYILTVYGIGFKLG